MSTINNSNPILICVDWGSSNFRAFLLGANAQVLDFISSDKGVLKLEQDKFQTYLLGQISPWLLDTGVSTILMSGMVGSVQGWNEVEYVTCPAELTQLSQKLHWISNSLNLQIAIVPGLNVNSLTGQPDVMRGEEVQIFGAASLIKKTA